MMELILLVNGNWIYVSALAVALWGLLFLYRKSHKSEIEIKKQVLFGIIGSILGLTADLIGTSLNLWHFTDGDAPLLIILIYFFVGMFFYNAIKIVEKYYEKHGKT